MFLVNSRLGLFAAAYLRRRPFSRSYGAILPSSLTTVVPSVSVYSTSPPVSVCGTGKLRLGAYAFLGQVLYKFTHALPSFGLGAAGNGDVQNPAYTIAAVTYDVKHLNLVQECLPAVHRDRFHTLPLGPD